MKLTVSNQNKIIHNAFIRETDLAFSLIINTVKKWIDYDQCSSDDMTRTWKYYVTDTSEYDAIILTAESVDDKKILSRLRFTLLEKDQLWILFPREEVL